MKHFDQEKIFSTLKQILKAKKISYHELSKNLSFSEATLKVIFHKRNTSIERLVEICDIIGLTFPDLVQLASRDERADFSFTLEQEQFFVDYPNYYNFFREVFFEKKTAEEVQKQYKLSDASTFKYLRGLEKIGVLEIYPNNKLKFNFYGRLKFPKDGPWMKKYFTIYSEKITESLLSHLHTQEYFTSFGYFTIPKETLNAFREELMQLEKKYKDIAFRDSHLEKKEEFVPVTWLFDIIPEDISSHDTSIPNLK